VKTIVGGMKVKRRSEKQNTARETVFNTGRNGNGSGTLVEWKTVEL
jgi:hypothetical protein